MIVRLIYIFVALLLFCYIAFASYFYKDWRMDIPCRDLIVVVKDSLDKHFVTESDLISYLKRVDLDPIDKPLSDINTELIEQELLTNEMIANVEAYKTPSGALKLEVTQKMPVLRVLGTKGNFYVDNQGGTMPVSRRYVAHVPLATGHVEREVAVTDLYDFALFLQANEFWNNQIEQIHVYANGEVELIPRVGSHRIMLGTFEGYKEKLENLQLFYDQAVPKIGWEKYSMINLKYKDQIVCTKK